MTVISDLLDRVHVINQTISYSKLTCYRYFPGTNGKLPFIVPMLGAATHQALGTLQGGDSGDFTSTREVILLCAVASPSSGVPIETAHAHAENIIDPLLQAYANAPYLETSAGELDSIFDYSLITADTGIVVSRTTGYFEIRFTLTAQLIRNL